MNRVLVFIFFWFLISCDNSAQDSLQQPANEKPQKSVSASVEAGCNLPSTTRETNNVIIPIPNFERYGALVSLRCGDALLIGNHVQRFDVSTRSWKSLMPLKIPRMSPKALLLGDGRILIEGGYIEKNGKFEHVSQVEIYDPSSQTSVLKSSPIGPLKYGTMVQISDSQVFIFGQSEPIQGWNCNRSVILNLNDMTSKEFGGLGIYCPEAKAYKLKSGDIMFMSDVNGFSPGILRVKSLRWELAPGPQGNNGISGVTTDGKVFLSVNKGGATWVQKDEGKLLEWNDETKVWDTIADVERPRDGSGFYGIAKAIGLTNGKHAFYSRRKGAYGFDGDIYDSTSKTWTPLPKLSHGGWYGPVVMALVASNQFIVINQDVNLKGSSELVSF
jgi:hypothetical protein